jgi:hypothetical protein
VERGGVPGGDGAAGAEGVALELWGGEGGLEDDEGAAWQWVEVEHEGVFSYRKTADPMTAELTNRRKQYTFNLQTISWPGPTT